MPVKPVDPSLGRQVFPPGTLGDLLYAAGKLPGEAGNLWGKVKSMMPMQQNDPQNVFPQRAGMQPPPPAPGQAPGQQMLPGSDLMTARPPVQFQPPAPPQPGAMQQPPVMPQPGAPQPGAQPQSVVWGGRQANPGMMRPAMQQQFPQLQPPPLPNIFGNRAMAY